MPFLTAYIPVYTLSIYFISSLCALIVLCIRLPKNSIGFFCKWVKNYRSWLGSTLELSLKPFSIVSSCPNILDLMGKSPAKRQSKYTLPLGQHLLKTRCRLNMRSIENYVKLPKTSSSSIYRSSFFFPDNASP